MLRKDQEEPSKRIEMQPPLKQLVARGEISQLPCRLRRKKCIHPIEHRHSNEEKIEIGVKSCRIDYCGKNCTRERDRKLLQSTRATFGGGVQLP